jgi:CheY-like chemotaxis protein
LTQVTRPKLLLADDSVTIRKVVELTFADEGIDVSTVADAEAAMAKFVEIQPDIVLVDVGLSGTNGYQICEMIKQDEATRHIPVLLLVGSFEPFDQTEAERVEADGFLTKPFHSIRDLVARVWELLGRETASATPTTESNDAESPVAPRETTDIENLYRSSFTETGEIEEFDTVDDLLGDSGMDDEMIEASYPTQAFPDDFTDTAMSAEKVEQTKEFDWSPESIIAESIPVQPEKPPFEPKFVFDESDGDGTQIGGEPEPVEASIPDESPFSTQDDNEDESSETIEFSPYRDGAVDPLDSETEIAPLEPAFETVVASADSDLEEVPKDSEVVDPAIHDTSPYVPGEVPVVANYNNLKEPSPELIELIARRVVEKLSDSAIREIAQDAVPRIAEKLIREALADEKKA